MCLGAMELKWIVISKMIVEDQGMMEEAEKNFMGVYIPIKILKLSHHVSNYKQKFE